MTRLLRWSECQCQRVTGSTIAGAAAAVEAARPVRQAVVLASRGILPSGVTSRVGWALINIARSAAAKVTGASNLHLKQTEAKTCTI